MKFDEKNPPRLFPVGNAIKFDMADHGNMALAPNEQITFVTESGAEYDVARKDWGFYATPSLNARLINFGLRTVIIRNMITGRYFIFLVERGKEPEFEAYMGHESLEVIAWLDSTQACDALRDKVRAP